MGYELMILIVLLLLIITIKNNRSPDQRQAVIPMDFQGMT